MNQALTDALVANADVRYCAFLLESVQQRCKRPELASWCISIVSAVTTVRAATFSYDIVQSDMNCISQQQTSWHHDATAACMTVSLKKWPWRALEVLQ